MELENKEHPEKNGEVDPEKQSLNKDSDGPSSVTIETPGGCLNAVVVPVEAVRKFCGRNSAMLCNITKGVCLLGYIIYFIAAIIHDMQKAVPLICLTAFVSFCVGYESLKESLFGAIKNCCTCPGDRASFVKRWTKVIAMIGACALFIWLTVDIIMTDPQQLQSLIGLFGIVAICVVFSKHPGQISWRPVIWGIFFQFILGLLVLRTRTGYNIIKATGDQVVTFMKYTDKGSEFVFTDTSQHPFVFKILPMIIFFSTVTSVLYYLGLMQWFIAKLAFVTQITLGVSAIESTVAIANIFVGMTEAPLTVRPYLERLTRAEIHSIMCSGLGSIAFGVVGAYIDFGVDPVHLLTAIVMTAPATLVVSRLLYPETEKSEFETSASMEMDSGTQRNVVEAAANGASTSIGLVANIAANLIAFIAVVAFIDSTLEWFASFVGVENFGFTNICSYLFVPVAFLMGVEVNDCVIVGELVGTKTFINEFVAYEKLGVYIANRLNSTGPAILERSEAIATHALCGFCNVGSLGIIIGGLGVLMPKKSAELADMAVRALMGAMLSCFMTGSIAGLLFKPTIEADLLFSNSFAINMTTPAL